MSKRTDISIGAKVSREFGLKVKEYAKKKGCGVNAIVKEAVERYRRSR